MDVRTNYLFIIYIDTGVSAIDLTRCLIKELIEKNVISFSINEETLWQNMCRTLDPSEDMKFEQKNELL